MKQHNFTWFLHKPTDEREREFYQRANQAGFTTLCFCLILVLLGAWMFPNSQLDFSVIGWAALFALLLAYLSGWMMLRDEEISLDYPKPTQVLRKQAHLFWFCLIAIAGAGVLFIVLSPEYYVQQIFSFGLFAFLYSAATVLKLGKKIPLPARLALAVFLPLPTIIWLSANTTSVVKKIFLIIVLLMTVFLSMIITILALRQFVVAPYYVSTDDFAPDYKSGQYVLANYRQNHPTAGQYIVYAKGNNIPVAIAQVIATTGASQYRVRVGVGEQAITQDQVIGTITAVNDWWQLLVRP